MTSLRTSSASCTLVMLASQAPVNFNGLNFASGDAFGRCCAFALQSCLQISLTKLRCVLVEQQPICWLVKQQRSTVLFTSVANKPSLHVGQLAARVLTREAILFHSTSDMRSKSTSPTRRLICYTCVNARSHIIFGTDHTWRKTTDFARRSICKNYIDARSGTVILNYPHVS